MKTSFDSVLLLAFGGPTRPEEVRPFMDNVVRGKRVPRERYELVVQQYEKIGGASPFNQLTENQRAALERRLKADGIPLPVYLGYRHWPPYIKDTLATMAADRRRRAVGIILSPLRAEASWDVYLQAIDVARREIGDTTPALKVVEPWGLNPGYIATVVACIGKPGPAHIIFTAHSIPAEMARDCPYESQLLETAKQVVIRLAHSHWSTAFQSRSGRLEDKWLEPDVRDEVRRLAARNVREIVIAPIGFVTDHAEILFDLDVAAAEVAAEVGVRVRRAPAANDHPLFIKMLAELVRSAIPSPL